MRNSGLIQGFTLIELLIASAVGIFMLGVMINLFVASQRITTATVNQADSSERLQLVAGIIGDDVRRSLDIVESVTPESWTAAPSGATGITLDMAADDFCGSSYKIAHYAVDRTSLTATSVSEWIRVPTDARNTTQKVLLRATKCGTTVDTRIVADYLDNPTFEIALGGTGTFTSTPTAYTMGYRYRSVRLSLASLYNGRENTTRIPSTGSLVFLATSRAVTTKKE